MTRPRRPTRIDIDPPSPPPIKDDSRIRVDTDNAIGLAIPESLAPHRDKIIKIVHQINTGGNLSPQDNLLRYLEALAQIPEIAATHSSEITRARDALVGVLGRKWKDIADATSGYPVLKPMLLNLK